MSGLEVIGLALAAVSASTGVISAAKGSKGGHRHSNTTTVVLEERKTKHLVNVSGDAFASASKHGAYARSTQGTAMAAYSEDYSCRRK